MKLAMEGLDTYDGVERRSRIRFPMALIARYAVVGQQEVQGTGRTMNISSHGSLIASTLQWAPGTTVRVVIEWPTLYGCIRPLALFIHGKAIRSHNGQVAVQFSHHEWRTRGHAGENSK
jgi:hypothetical protein